MKHRGFSVVIPARYASTRFPGKLLAQLGDCTVLESVYRQVCLAQPQRICIATDHEAIAEVATRFGADVWMTKTTHVSGTDRIAQVVTDQHWHHEDIVVNVQGDEPFISPVLIAQVAELARQGQADMATLCWPIDSIEAYHHPNVVKVVKNMHDRALYFSRSPIPSCDITLFEETPCWRHIGIYAYTVKFLKQYVAWTPCALEKQESLEQLRALWYGAHIAVPCAVVSPKQDINTPEDLVRANALLSEN